MTGSRLVESGYIISKKHVENIPSVFSFSFLVLHTYIRVLAVEYDNGDVRALRACPPTTYSRRSHQDSL